jgi:hypothetical protein
MYVLKKQKKNMVRKRFWIELIESLLDGGTVLTFSGLRSN